LADDDDYDMDQEDGDIELNELSGDDS